MANYCKNVAIRPLVKCCLGIGLLFQQAILVHTARYGIVYIVVCLFMSSDIHALELYPDLHEIVQSHEAQTKATISGRIEYRIVRTRDIAMLNELKDKELENSKAVLEHLKTLPISEGARASNLKRFTPEEDSKRAAMRYLQETVSADVKLVFDRVTNSRIETFCDNRDIDKLGEAYGLGALQKSQLMGPRIRCLVDGKEVKYNSGCKIASFDASEAFRLDSEDILTFGMLDRSILRPDAKWQWEELPTRAPNCAKLVFTFGNSRLEALVDLERGCRVTEFAAYRDDKKVQEYFCAFRDCGGIPFPVEYSERRYGADGKEVSRDDYVFSSVELNVPIMPKEFEISIPQGAQLFDSATGMTIRNFAGYNGGDGQSPFQLSVNEIAEEILRRSVDAKQEKVYMEQWDNAMLRKTLQTPSSQGQQRTASNHGWMWIGIGCVGCVVAFLVWRIGRQGGKG